jgi:hypothetical protein
VKDLLDKAAEVAPSLKITCADINNNVMAMKDPPKQWEVSPVIPNHAIGCPTLSTDSDSSIFARLISKKTYAVIPLEILASQANVGILEPTSAPRACNSPYPINA